MLRALYVSSVAALLISLPVATSSCSTSRSKEALTETNQSTSDSLKGTVDTHAAVVEALKRWITVKSFRQRFTATSSGASSSGTMEFVAPDCVHFVMNVAGEPFESITIGQTEYSKDLDGKWIKTDTFGQSSSQGRLFTDPRHIAALADNISEAQFLNTETVEGTSCVVYQFKHKLPGTDGVYESKLWLGDGDGLPRKFETTYDFLVEGLKRSGKSSGIYSDYDSDIRIEPPTP